jgi:uncharacterized membrane protein YGL010W
MFAGKSWKEWIHEYGHSHQHPVNLACHTVGIPLIVISLPLVVIALFVRDFWKVPLVMFVVGWVLQFAGHAIEGKKPEFLRDWRFLVVGLRWWFAKMRGDL